MKRHSVSASHTAIGESSTRKAWQKPSVRRLRAGMAEVGFTNTVDDGPGTKS